MSTEPGRDGKRKKGNESPKCFLVINNRRNTIVPSGLIVGRDRDCDLLLDDAKCSSHHAKIVPLSGGITILDMNSRNGTFVNGERVSERRLVHGDIIRIGDHDVRFVIEVPQPEASRKSWIVPGRMGYRCTQLALVLILVGLVYAAPLENVVPFWGETWEHLTRPIARPAEIPASKPSRAIADRVPHSPDSQSLATRDLQPATRDPSSSDLDRVSRMAFESLVNDVRDALATGEFEKAESSVAAFRKSPLSGGFALDLFNLDQSIAGARKAHVEKEREATARREARFKEIEAKVQQAVAAEDFDDAKAIAETLEDNARVPTLLALIDKAREEHINQRLPRRRDFYGSMILRLRPFLAKRDYAGAINKIGTLGRSAEYRLHLPMLQREEERLKTVNEAYRSILDRVRKIPPGTAVSISQNDGKVLKGKFTEVKDDILWLDHTIGVKLTDIAMVNLVALAKIEIHPLTLANLYLYEEDFVDASTAIAEIIDDESALEFFARLEMAQKSLREADQPPLVAAVDREIAKGNLTKAGEILDRFDRKYSFPIIPDSPIADLQPATCHLQLVADLRSRLSSSASSVMIGNIPFSRLNILRSPGNTGEKVTLLKSLKVVGEKAVIPFIASALKDEAAQVRLEGARAMTALAKHVTAHPDKDEIVWTLILLLSDPAAEVGFAAADAVKQLGYSADAIRDRAKDRPEEMLRAVVAAGMLSDEKLAPLARDGLSGTDWRIRKESALALAKIRDKSAGSALVAALKKEPHDDVVAAISYALGAIEYGSGVGPVNDILKRQPDHPYKKELVQAIARMGGGSASAALKPMLKDLDPWIRHYAVEGLVESGAKLKEEEVVHLLADDRWLNRAGAVKALIAGGESKSLDTIVKTLDDAHPAVRATAHHGLMMAKDLRVIPEIVKHLDGLGGEGKTLALDILKRLTKQNVTTSAEWKQWWAANGGGFRLPPMEDRYKIPEPERRKP